ncbi:hypothetical protein HZA85_00435 [Candidatus Uhrbacteria bacterium]|nr:hypothetical protein [Candidatus Uhrbacteria bacterium]
MTISFLSPGYWFSLRPALVGGLTGNIIFSAFVILFVLGIVSRIVAKQKSQERFVRDLGARAGSLLATMGLLGVLLYFFSFERIPMLGARFWYLFWVIGAIVWIIFLVRYARVTLPQRQQRDQERAQLRRYLPTKKT